MQLEDFAEYFSLTAGIKDFISQYGFTAMADSLETVPDSLDEKFILQQLNLLHDPPPAEPLLKAAQEIRSSKYLLSCYNYLDYYWFRAPKMVMYGTELPGYGMNPLHTEQEGLYYLLNALASFPYIARKYAALGLPGHYAKDTVQYLSGALTEYAAGHDNKLGITGRKLHWFSFYVQGKLFRIGRFEYMIQDPLNYLPAAYKHRTGGKVIALCRHNWLLAADGSLLFDSDSPAEAYKIATLENDGKSISGIPVNPEGFAEVDRRVTLDLAEYIPLWNNWDLVPGLHIPGGGNMTPEACCDSLNQALDFFPRYFKRQVTAVSCFSWIFNPDFEKELPESNLAKFMRQLYLFPFASVGVEGLAFVFGKHNEDWENFPADNSLRRAFHRIHASGRRLRAGGMFITPEAIRNFGESFYRKNYDI